MDWTNERYLRAYTRDTADYLVLGWQARGLWWEVLRKADRSGVIATNHGPKGVAALVRWPLEVVETALAELLADGCVQECDGGYVIPNYIAANESPSSNAQRKRESREQRRLQKVTNRDQKSRAVTAGHAESHGVTPSLAEPNQERDREASPTPLALSAQLPKAEDRATALSKAAVDEINRLRGSRHKPDCEETLRACRALVKRGVTPEKLVAAIRYIACPRKGSEGWLAVEHLRDRVCPETLLQTKRVMTTIATIEATTGPPQLRIVPRADDDYSRIPGMGDQCGST